MLDSSYKPALSRSRINVWVPIVHINHREQNKKRILFIYIGELERELRKRVQSFIAVTEGVKIWTTWSKQELWPKLVLLESGSQSLIANSFFELHSHVIPKAMLRFNGCETSLKMILKFCLVLWSKFGMTVNKNVEDREIAPTLISKFIWPSCIHLHMIPWHYDWNSEEPHCL